MKYKIDKYAFKELENKVILPSFQRPLVWKDIEKKRFIETLKKGYPFGSILIYKYEDSGKYSLIDGLQRYTTILDFRDDPSKYMEVDHFVEELIEQMEKTQKINQSQRKQYEIILSNKIKEVIETHTKNERLDIYHLYDQISGPIPGIESLERYITNLQSKIINFSKEYLDINEIVIPCIEFIGDQSELAEVFENLNRGGKKLSKYQVFAAQWSNSEIMLAKEKNSANVLDRVIERYTKLNETRQIEIKDFDENLMRNERKINLSELCYAIGVLIVEELSVFFGKDGKDKEDLANEIGYSTMGILMNVPNNQLHKVINKEDFFVEPQVVEELIGKTLDVYKNINSNFEKYLVMPGNTTKFQSKEKTSFQIMSFFAALWITRFEVDFDEKSIKTNSNYRSKYNDIINNFIKYYILDIVNRNWRGSGDSSLNAIYIQKNNKYATTLERDKLSANLFEWYDETLNKSSIRLEGVSKTLLTIHNSFNRNYYSADKYDFEHIVAQKKLRTLYKEHEIPGGSLGNIMFMDQGVNRSKKDDNLYTAKKEGYKIDEDYLKMVDYPSENRLSKIENDLNTKESKSTKEFIRSRGQAILNSLIDNIYKV